MTLLVTFLNNSSSEWRFLFIYTKTLLKKNFDKIRWWTTLTNGTFPFLSSETGQNCTAILLSGNTINILQSSRHYSWDFQTSKRRFLLHPWQLKHFIMYNYNKRRNTSSNKCDYCWDIAIKCFRRRIQQNIFCRKSMRKSETFTKTNISPPTRLPFS